MGDESTNPARTLGAPVDAETLPDGQRLIRFTNGVVHRTSEQAPGVRLTGSFHEHWLAAGGLDGPLGAPLSPAVDLGIDEGRSQAFVGGRLHRGYDLDSEIETIPYTSEERTLGDANETLVEVEGQVYWWIDTRGERHWGQTPCTFRHLKATRANAVLSRSAVSIAHLPIGERVATC